MSSVLTPEETAALRENMPDAAGSSSPSEQTAGAAVAPPADGQSAAGESPGVDAPSAAGASGGGGSSAGASAAGGEPPSEPESFVFGSGQGGVRKKLPSMEKRFAVLAEHLRLSFSKSLRSMVSVDVGAVKTYNAAQIGEAVPSWAAAVEMGWTNLGHAGYIGLNHALSFALIELAYGAPPAQLQTFELKDARSRLTEVERQTLAPLLQNLAQSLADVMPEHIVGAVTTSALPFPVQLDPSKTVEGGIFKTFEFTVGRTKAQICVLLFSHILEHLDDDHPSSNEQTSQMLSAHIGQTDVEVTAMLGKTSVPLNYVLNLQAGDMLWLDCAQSDSLPVFVEQSIKFLAQPIARNGALGVEIVATV